MDDYLRIFLTNRKPVVARMTMKTMLEKLPADRFARVHRSYIVPVSRIDKVRNKIIFIGDKQIPIGNSYEKGIFRE